MRKIALALFGIMLIIGCNSKELTNQWSDKPITIDGHYDDWEEYELQFFEDENLMMGTVNDAENLYIMFRFTDQQLVQKIQMRGVTLWLDKEAKKEKRYGVKYTGSVNLHLSDRPEISNSDQSPMDRQERMQMFMDRIKANLPEPGKIWLIEGEQETELAENQVSGVSAGSINHDGLYCYEFRIPIPMGIQKNTISLCIEFGGLTSEQISEMRSQDGPPGGMGRGRPGGDMGGMPGGMGGGRRGGGMGGGRPPGGMDGGRPDMSHLEAKDIWMKIILAEK